LLSHKLNIQLTTKIQTDNFTSRLTKLTQFPANIIIYYVETDKNFNSILIKYHGL
jgi:hypothetical protein